MAIGEFAIIDRFFRSTAADRDDVRVGIGDDGAVLAIDEDRRLVTTLCSAGPQAWHRHAGDAARIGDEVMAAALNRLAAAGGQPAFATLALTLPEADEQWLEAFSNALLAVAEHARVELVGGDTTRGPFTATVVAHGLLDAETAERAPRVRPGDGIYVSGRVGIDAARRRMPSPIPVALGVWVRSRGGVAADLSEGLEAALSALLSPRGLGASVELARLPLAGDAPRTGAAWAALAHHRGDVELCFTLDRSLHEALVGLAATLDLRVTRIARVDDSGRRRLVAPDAAPLAPRCDAWGNEWIDERGEAGDALPGGAPGERSR